GRQDIGTGTLRNRTDGGDSGPSWKGVVKSESHRKSLSLSLMGNTNGTGHKVSEEEKKKLRGRMLGTSYALGAVRTKETRDKLSSSGIKGWRTRARLEKRMALCHPDREHQGKGLCMSCYNTAYNKMKKAATAAAKE